MAILSKGKTFTSGDQVTATGLNELVDNATFASGAVDDSTTQLSSGRIIVKDSGITSSKLNLSVNGSSQNIAQFKTVQGSSARALSIRTPASTTDVNSPFEIATGNAIQFICDDHTVTIDSDGKTIFGNGSTPSSKSQVNIATDDNLGGTSGDTQSILALSETVGSNLDSLLFTSQRTANGSDWTTAAHRIQRKVDSTKMGYIQLGNKNEANGGLITFGEDETERMRIDAEGHVGIGTTTPSEALEVSGNILATNGTESVQLANTGSIEIRHSSGPFIDFKNANEDRDCRIFQDSDGLGFQVGGSGAVATRMELTSDGTVKIKGQASDGDANLQLISTSGSDTSKLGFGDNGDADVGGITYSHSDNSMRFATATTERIRIEDNGNVGIGETSPDTILHVKGGVPTPLKLERTGGSAQNVNILFEDGNTDWYAGKAGSSGFGVGTSADLASSAKFIIDDSGNVGIGTTSPTATLHVVDQGGSGPCILTQGASSSEGDIAVIGGEKMQFGHWSGTAFTERMVIDDVGRVGIGNTSPSQKLHINSGNIKVVNGGTVAPNNFDGGLLQLSNSDGSQRLSLDPNEMLCKDTFHIRVGHDKDIKFQHVNSAGDGTVDLMYIDSSAARVGIGTTSPSSELEVVGDVRANNIVGREANNGIIIKSDPQAPDASNGGSQIALYSQDFTATRSQIFHRARYSTFQGISGTDIVIIGDQSGTNTLKVVGNIEYTGSISDISDRRLKENIEPLTGSLDKICQLEAKSYTMVDDEDKTEELGFIAQDVQQIFPNLVKENTDDEKPEDERGDPYLSVSYMQLIAPMVEAIKELKSENEALKARVAALES